MSKNTIDCKYMYNVNHKNVTKCPSTSTQVQVIIMLCKVKRTIMKCRDKESAIRIRKINCDTNAHDDCTVPPT